MYYCIVFVYYSTGAQGVVGKLLDKAASAGVHFLLLNDGNALRPRPRPIPLGALVAFCLTIANKLSLFACCSADKCGCCCPADECDWTSCTPNLLRRSRILEEVIFSGAAATAAFNFAESNKCCSCDLPLLCIFLSTMLNSLS